MIRRYFFRASVHPVLLAVTSTAHDRWHNCSDAIHRQCIRSSGVEGLVAKMSLLVSSWLSDGSTLPLTMVSVHPVLQDSSWCVSVLIQTEHQIDRWCPLSDRRIIRCYCLRWSSSAIHSTHLHFACCAVYQVHWRLNRWYRQFIRRCPFYSFPLCLQLGSLLQLNILNILNMPSLIPPKYILSPHLCYK
jgi:hypothetical protein